MKEFQDCKAVPEIVLGPACRAGPFLFVEKVAERLSLVLLSDTVSERHPLDAPYELLPELCRVCRAENPSAVFGSSKPSETHLFSFPGETLPLLFLVIRTRQTLLHGTLPFVKLLAHPLDNIGMLFRQIL